MTTGFGPWSWTWPWIFKAKYGITHITAKNDPIATKRKASISIELQASNVTIRCDLSQDLDLEFSRSNMEFVISQPKVVRLPRNKKQTYRLNSRPNMCPRALTLAIILQFEFSRSNVTLTFWRPRSGVRIYQIVTRVTLDVGVPSTNLVLLGIIFHLTHLYFLYFYALQIQLDMAGISPRTYCQEYGQLTTDMLWMFDGISLHVFLSILPWPWGSHVRS